MKKIVIALLLSCVVSSVFASKTLLSPNNFTRNEMIHWKFSTLDDGYVFVLGQDRQEYWIIKNNKFVDGLPSDTLEVHCNGITQDLTAGESITCYGNYDDISHFNITPKPNGLKNGAEGTFEYVEPATK